MLGDWKNQILQFPQLVLMKVVPLLKQEKAMLVIVIGLMKPVMRKVNQVTDLLEALSNNRQT
jgi:methanogenic corrinoid protein MtbC1